MSMKVSTAELSHNAREEKFVETERRPPALGEEEHDFSSTRSSTSNQSQVSAASGKSAGDGCSGVHIAAITPRKSMLGIGMATMGCGERMSSLKDMSDEPPMGYEPEGSAAATPPFTETSTPPAYLKWAESLRGLLDDQEGIELFRTYLVQEQCLDSLDFWLACNGLKKKSAGDETEIQMIIRAIYNKYVRSSNTLAMTSETRKAIKRKVQTKCGVNQTIFDRAHAEVEASISSTTYPNFLRSDLYLQFVQGVLNGGADSPKLSDSGGGDSGSSSTSGGTRPAFGFLPTVDENKELHVAAPNPQATASSSTLPLTHHHLCLTQQRRAGYGYRKAEAHAGHYLQQSTKPLAHPYHAMYASCIPVSAQDSELQSLSSDAHTDDTMSLTDGSVDGMPAYPSKKYLRQQHHVMRQNASQNREIDPGHNLIPRTLRIPQSQMTPMEPCKFAAILTEKLEKVARDRETQEKLMERLNKEVEEVAVSTTSQLPDDHLVISLPAGVLKMSITDELDHQSILDKHVDSLWNVESPHRTPPRRRSPERRRASAPPAVPPFVGAHTPKGLVMSYPGSHHRQRREQDIVSTFSSDSGMVHDYSDMEFAVPPSTLLLSQEPATGGVLPPHHHKLGTKNKVSPKSPSTVLPELADANVRAGNYPLDPYVLPDTNLDRERRSKDSSRRSGSKKISAVDSSSSCVDSGISTAYEASLPPVLNTLDRVRCWIEGNEKYASSHHPDSEKDSSTRHRKSSYSSMSATSPVASRPGRVKKPVAYNSSRSGSLDRGGTQCVWAQPSQPLAQDPSMPMLPPPNTTTQLEEARRRLEDDTKARLSRSKPNMCGKDKTAFSEVQKSRSSLSKGCYLGEIQEEVGGTMKKAHKYSASLPSSSNAPPASVTSESDYTVVGYYFCGDTVPYKTHLPGTNITLRQFKTLINPKKGNFRFFFKKASDEFGTGVVKEEISDDNQVLPLWDGKIFAVVEAVD